MSNQALERIEAQQKKLKSQNNTYWLGEQLKDICRAEPYAAELVAQDLVNPEMDIVHLEKKIKDYADAHREGGQACVPPQVADRIIREFYGIPVSGETAKPAHAASKVNSIFDLF